MQPAALSQVSWSCVHFAPAAARAALVEGAGRSHVATLDGGGVTGEEDLLGRLATAFGAPAYFGRNWDALDEVLRDLDWLPAGAAGSGHVLLVEGAAALWGEQRRAAGRLVEAWLGAAEVWAGDGVPFHLVFLW